MEKINAPIYNMLLEYCKKKPVPFHMPGHLLGRGLFGIIKNAGSLDITEIPGADDLHAPKGVIKEARTMASALFGAYKTLFLVNGSTLGIHAMIHASVRPGGKVIVGRDCHKSVLNALVILDAHPVFIMPEFDDEEQLPLGYAIDSIKNAIDKNPDSQAIILTRPNYYGAASKIEEISAHAKSKGIPLLIDEAHGAHFIFHPEFPQTALRAGADVCVQSLHKTLPALTQTALLHVGNNSLIDIERLESYASMLQTTSPSYILMASIDLMREAMEKSGKRLYSDLYERIGEFTDRLSEIHGVRLISSFKNCDRDFTRLVLSFKESHISGYEAEAFLREKKGIVAEMADLNHIVLIVTPFHTGNDLNALLSAIKELICLGKIKRSKDTFTAVPFPNARPLKKLGLREAFYATHRDVPVSEAEGRVCAASVVPYPPGIPLVYPGEVITGNVLEYVIHILSSGGSVHGIIDNRIRVIG